MMSFSLITDFVLVVLLVAALFYVLKLLRRLGDLQKDRDSFEKLIQDFTAATAQAERSLSNLGTGADGVGRELRERIGKGQGVVGELQRSSDDLKMLIARAEHAADKLELLLGAARPTQQPVANLRAEGELPGAQDPQTQALLSALGRIR